VGLLAQAIDELATQLRSRIRLVEAERERLATVVSHMADGVIITGRDGNIQLANPAAAQLLRLPSVPKGRSLVAAAQDHELAAMVRAVLAGDIGAEQPQLITFGPIGQLRAIQAVASRLPNGEDGDARVLLILQDVTELRRTEVMRRELVANISHELRTPVAALKAVVETLEEGALEDPAVARDFLGRMHVEVDELAQVIQELLELSRIESGQVALRLQLVDLGPVVVAAAERLRPQAERQGVALVVQIPSDRFMVKAEPERIQQVVINLVHNAIKFTPCGGQITVGLEARDAEVAVVVADTGEGIASVALARLFERFYKADRARTGGGTGLGLAIAKHLIQAHGGHIWAESAGVGQGATFTFTLPRILPSASR
jgi:two-component system phosphate regulon sensor histidine kinase PhoR